jgi:hypothetical protein
VHSINWDGQQESKVIRGVNTMISLGFCQTCIALPSLGGAFLLNVGDRPAEGPRLTVVDLLALGDRQLRQGMKKRPRKPASDARINAFREAISQLSTNKSDERLREALRMPAPYKRPVGRSRLAKVKSTDSK